MTDLAPVLPEAQQAQRDIASARQAAARPLIHTDAFDDEETRDD